jgi:ubiquinol-cytochrome c reductase subunit 8
MPQKGIVHYGLAANRQKPLAGVANAAVFNTFRRTRNQILFWAVPMIVAYELMEWATER